LLCFVKKLTVIGIIGNTQGVNKAANPDKNAKKKIDHKLIEGFGPGISFFTDTALDSVFTFSVLAFSIVGFKVSTAIPITLVSSNFASVMVGIVASIFNPEGTKKENFLFRLLQTSLQT
jgi:hypothetical protein